MKSTFYKEFVRLSNAFIVNENYEGTEFVIADFGSSRVCLCETQLNENQAIEIAWSANTIGLLNIFEDHVIFYSYLRMKPETIRSSYTESSMSAFVKYISENYSLGHWSICRMLREEYVGQSKGNIQIFIDEVFSRTWFVNGYSMHPIRSIAEDLVQVALQSLSFNAQFGKGQYSFPSYIGDMLADLVDMSKLRAKDTIEIFDPSCGFGTLIIRFVDYLRRNGYTGKVKVRGWDYDMNLATLCRERMSRYDANIKSEIENKDSLTEPWPHNIDVVLLDPPVMDYENSNGWSDYKLTTYSILNIAAVFMSKSELCLAEDGQVLAAIPIALFKQNQFSAWRRVFSNHIHPKSIISLGSGLFDRTHDKMALFAGSHVRSKDVKFVWTGTDRVSVNEIKTCIDELDYVREFRTSGCCEGYRISFEDMPSDTWEPFPISMFRNLNILQERYRTRQLVRLGSLFIPKYCKAIPASKYNTEQTIHKLSKSQRAGYAQCVIASHIFNGTIDSVVYIDKSLLDQDICSSVRQSVMVSKKVAYKGAIMPLPAAVECVSDGYVWAPKETVCNKEYVCAYMAVFMSRTFGELLSVQVPEMTTYGLMNLTAENLKKVLIPAQEVVERYMQYLIPVGECLTRGAKLSEDIENIIKEMYGIV